MHLHDLPVGRERSMRRNMKSCIVGILFALAKQFLKQEIALRQSLNVVEIIER